MKKGITKTKRERRPARTGRPGRFAVALLLGAQVLAAGACSGLGATGPEPSATPPRVVESGSPVPEPSPEVTPVPTGSETLTPAEPTVEVDPTEAQREAELERLRRTNFFVEFAEADRARHATWARFAYDHFKVYDDEQVLFEWANKDELWDSIAPKVRDECLLAGHPATRPMWDAQIVIPASLNPSWDHDATGGRGHFVDFVCIHQTAQDDLAELWIGSLIREADREGTLISLSAPLLVPEAEHTGIESARETARAELWNWVMEQQVIEGE